MEDKKEEKVDVKNNEDVLEEIEEIEEIEEPSKEDDKSSEVKNVPNENASISDDVILGDTTKDDSGKVISDTAKSEIKAAEDDSTLTAGEKNNKKVLIIILLSILLIIDLAALIIYLIGIEKFISFIK